MSPEERRVKAHVAAARKRASLTMVLGHNYPWGPNVNWGAYGGRPSFWKETVPVYHRADQIRAGGSRRGTHVGAARGAR